MLRYAITDRRLLASDEPAQRAALLRQAAHLARTSSADFLQLREKDLSPFDLIALARDLRLNLETHAPDPATRPHLLINTHAEVAIAARADGVHLTSAPDALRPSDVRRLYSRVGLPTPTISLSCHSLEEIVGITQAPANAPDLILFGPIFEKRVTGRLISPGIGVAHLAEGCRLAAPIPILALGGITPENSPACLEAGAAGIAAIRLFQNLSA